MPEHPGVQPISSQFIDASTPSTSIKHYLSVLNATIDNLALKEPYTLFVNTCGWVDGLGKEFHSAIFESLRPTHLISMTKPNKFENEFVAGVVEQQKQLALKNAKDREWIRNLPVLQVVNDSFESVNVKGSVNRNRRLIQALIRQAAQAINSKTLSFRLASIKPRFLEFSQFFFEKNAEAKEWDKIEGQKRDMADSNQRLEYLQDFNAQIVSLMHIKTLNIKSTDNLPRQASITL